MVIKFLKSAFTKTTSLLGQKIKSLFSSQINDKTLDELYKLLYEADLGTKTADYLVECVSLAYKKNKKITSDEIIQLIKDELLKILNQFSSDIQFSEKNPTTILIVGVNGNGKTTSLAKLANLYNLQGKKTLIAAADTFRAAAIDQLTIWAKRIGSDIVKGQPASDPAAVVYDGLEASISRGCDIFLIDTAGRLHTKKHLLQELEKIKRVLQKKIENAPHETLLVIDANIGQNAVEQAKIFHEYTPITGLILTKFDGTAKGGVVVAIQRELNIPVKFIGTGEKVEDIQPFNPKYYIESLFG